MWQKILDFAYELLPIKYLCVNLNFSINEGCFMTKKEKRVNKMWYTMWWQYAWVVLGIISPILGFLFTLIFDDKSYVYLGFLMIILYAYIIKVCFGVGDYYRERHPLYAEKSIVAQKKIQINRVWHTMWWQYIPLIIGVGGMIFNIIRTVVLNDTDYIVFGFGVFIPELLLYKVILDIGNRYRERDSIILE